MKLLIFLRSSACCTRGLRFAQALKVVVAALLLLVPAAAAPIRSLTGAAAAPWERVELLRNPHPELKREPFLRSTKPADLVGEGILDGFGSDTPASSDVLLHYAPGWDAARQAVPVILVHGTGSNANHSFGVPRDGHGELVRSLAREGFAVFAVSFAAPYGCNYMQRETLHAAIERVRAVTGAARVDLMGHSKGAAVVRMLVSDVRRPWGAPFAGQVRRALLIASPTRGVDFTFRHPNSATFAFPALGAPFAGPRDMTYMVDLDGSRGLFGGAHEGVLQLTADLAREHPYSLLEVDGLVSRIGGWGTLGHYPGIEKAVARSGNLIATLEERGVDPRVELAVLAGTRRDFDHDGRVIPGERDGPSDGLVLETSASATGGLTRRGARLLEMKKLPLNHGELVWKPAAIRWIAGQLR